ncbi:MAG: hypothetical protein AB7S26_02255 [Sandaracinaceae bacterium]
MSHTLRAIVASLVAVLLVLVSAADVSAQRRRGRRRRTDQHAIAVTVTDVAAGGAYVSPGSTGGLHVGAEVDIDRRTYRVVGITASHARIDTADHPVEVGARGNARVRPASADGGPERLEEPTPLSEFEGAWTDATRPAASQSPEPVPLGGALQTARQLVLDVSTRGYAFIPTRGSDDAIGRAELRVRVHAQPWTDLPLTLDADASVQLWLGDSLQGGPGSQSRPYLRVRELQIAYGNQEDFYASLGRLRYAASTLGQLDGIRVQSPQFAGITIAGFGGFVPDPQSGLPAFDVGRFGLEATFRDFESELRPMISLVGHGSVFNGEIDERRLSAAFHLYPGQSHIGGYAELSAFDTDNPWGLDEVVLTAASLDTTLRFDWFRVGLRGSMRMPERSKWLAASYPSSFLCTPVPNPTGPEDRCLGFLDTRTMGNADVGIEVDDVALTAGATMILTGVHGQFDQAGAFLAFRAVRILGMGYIDASAMASTGYFLETLALRTTLGLELIPNMLDVSLRYRPALSQYVADIDPFVEHLFGGRVLVRPIPAVDILLNADGLVGRQIDAFLIELAVGWHQGF